MASAYVDLGLVAYEPVDVLELRAGARWLDREYPGYEGWHRLRDYLNGRTILEIGCVLPPTVALWSWASRRIMVGPSADTYKTCISERGFTWSTSLETHVRHVEEFVAEIGDGGIDGAIVCRNYLNRTEKPFYALANISAYAAPGCTLLLRTDLYRGEPQRGCRNITADRASFRRAIEQFGFEILHETPSDTGSSVTFGCYAIKHRGY